MTKQEIETLLKLTKKLFTEQQHKDPSGTTHSVVFESGYGELIIYTPYTPIKDQLKAFLGIKMKDRKEDNILNPDKKDIN